MILQTGMRTDIPAFYTKWFLNRIKEGFVLVRNPYNLSSVTRYDINPDVVDLIAFCTKNPLPMLPHISKLDAYGQYWFVTITPYGKEVEPNVPNKKRIIEAFRELSNRLGINCVGWRYDPIFVTDKYSVDFHISAFEKMAERLSGYTNRCIISFIDIYKKVTKNFPEVKALTESEKNIIGKAFADIGAKYKIEIVSCAEGDNLKKYGITTNGCLTKEIYEKALNISLDLPKRKSQRNECACFLGNDIGAYNTCPHLCRYCYANSDPYTVRQNQELHNPDSPFLIGNSQVGDKIHKAKQESWKSYQLTLEGIL